VKTEGRPVSSGLAYVFGVTNITKPDVSRNFPILHHTYAFSEKLLNCSQGSGLFVCLLPLGFSI
jgi:hypothetical protein